MREKISKIEIEREKRIITIKFFLLLGFIVFITILGIVLLFRTSKVPASEKVKGEPKFDSIFPVIRKDGIAIINIQGVIQFGSSCSLFGMKEDRISAIISKIRRYSKINKVKGIILRINSPGGTIGAVQEIYKAILEFRAKGKIVVASMGDIATSGGYYIAASADKIVANPGTKISALIFAFEAYAAKLAPILPVLAQTIFFMPNSLALVISTVEPLSLNTPVGFTPSYLYQ